MPRTLSYASVDVVPLLVLLLIPPPLPLVPSPLSFIPPGLVLSCLVLSCLFSSFSRAAFCLCFFRLGWPLALSHRIVFRERSVLTLVLSLCLPLYLPLTYRFISAADGNGGGDCDMGMVLLPLLLLLLLLQDKKIARSQRRLEEGGQGAMAMDTAALRKNEEIVAIEAQVRERTIGGDVQ